MDAVDFFLVRYDQVHRVLTDPALKQLSESQLRARPHPGVAWMLAQTPLLHVYGHYFEARAVAGLWGARSL